MFTITVRLTDGQSVSTELKNGRCIVGRLASRSDLTVHDPFVSSMHLAITEKDGGVFLEDLGSSNGTEIDDQKIEPHVVVSLPLGKDVIVGGSSLLTVSEQNDWEMTRVAPPTYKPRFVGVLYTDIVNSTPLTAKLGHEKATELLEWHNQTLRERFKRYGGRDTKFTGDGFEAIFPSVTEALGCAAACQRALARRNQQNPVGPRLEVRMGINCGEAPTSGKRVYGMPLILSARIMALASAAQVLVPAHVAGVVAGSLWRFTSVGPRQLKGIDEPMELLEFLWKLDPSIQAPEELRPPAPAPARKPTAPLA